MSFTYHRNQAANQLAELHTELAKVEAVEHLALALSNIAATFVKRF